MKIAIIGHGAMGREIESLCCKQNIVISNIFDIDNQLDINAQYDFDVAIDFSTPKSTIENVKILAQHKKNIVIGTTQWYEQLDEVAKIVCDSQIGAVWSSNFSIGMQLFFRLTKEAAHLFNDFSDYDSFMSEVHHKNKSDAPSGTALTLAQILLDNLQSKDKLLTENINRKISPNELHVASLRGGYVFGQHNIFFDSEADTIQLSHTAKSRQGFATGAVVAAKFIFQKTGFYNFADILFS